MAKRKAVKHDDEPPNKKAKQEKSKKADNVPNTEYRKSLDTIGVFCHGDFKRQQTLFCACYEHLIKLNVSFAKWINSHKSTTEHRFKQRCTRNEDETDAESRGYFVSKNARNKTQAMAVYDEKWSSIWSQLKEKTFLYEADVKGVQSGIDRSDQRKKFEHSVCGWLLHLLNGFNLLLEGTGSKIDYINALAAKIVRWKNETRCGTCFIVSGYDPFVNVHTILAEILTKISSEDFGNTAKDRLSMIVHALDEEEEDIDPLKGLRDDATLEQTSLDYVYIFVHNLDGPGLRTVEAQNLLSELSRLKRVRMVASIDHINANLLWDDAIESRYSFYRVDVTGYGLYRQESQHITIEEQDENNQGDYVVAIEHILTSVTVNHQCVYIILLEHCINEHSRIQTEEEIAAKIKNAKKPKKEKVGGMSLGQLSEALYKNYQENVNTNVESIRNALQGLKNHRIIQATSTSGDIYYSVTHSEKRQAQRIHDEVIARNYADRVRL
jgi:hypothetical protein